MQSVLAAQTLASAQPAQLPPPQSRSVSLPFFFRSLQVGAAQLPPVQTSEVQSSPVLQVLPSAHFAQGPPQSMSLSGPFFTLSPHMLGWHAPEQLPVAQSLPSKQ